MSDKELTQPSLIELSEYVYLTISGDKALHFLQGQLTCDINELTTTQALTGAYLNIQGRVIATIKVLYHEQQLLLQLPRNIAELVTNKLTRIAMLSKIKIQQQNDIKTIGVMGKNVADKLRSYFTTIPALFMQAIYAKNLTLLRVTTDEQFILIGSSASVKVFIEQIYSQQLDFRSDGTEQVEGVHPQYMTKEEQASNNAQNSSTKSVSLSIIDYNDWLAGLITEKIIEINATTSEHFTPHEIDLPAHNAVSFTKGCYVGQEIVARMQYLGKLKQHLQLLQWESPLTCQVLDKLFNQEQKPVGQIASICKVNNMQYALVVLRDDHLNAALFSENNEPIEIILHHPHTKPFQHSN